MFSKKKPQNIRVFCGKEKKVVKPSKGLINGVLGIPVTPPGCPVCRAKSTSESNGSKETISQPWVCE
jgi:hypothetical protein